MILLLSSTITILKMAWLVIIQISALEFSRDRKMMSVLCSRKHTEFMFSKGAPESIISRCTSILCNSDGSTAPLTPDIRAELEAKFNRLASAFSQVLSNCHCVLCLSNVFAIQPSIH